VRRLQVHPEVCAPRQRKREWPGSCVGFNGRLSLLPRVNETSRPPLHSGIRVPPGVLPLLRALTTGRGGNACTGLAPSTIESLVERGLGPVLAHVAQNVGGSQHLRLAHRIHAADLTARALTADKYSALSDVLSAARDVDCQVVLLKGAATALRYYPAPHLRAMGDLDLLVASDRQCALEGRLRALGFRQRSQHPAESFVGRHHSMPFRHPEREVWIDVHTQVSPRQYPLARDDRFSWAAVASQLSPIAVGGQTTYTMNHELQLVYTSARWAERFDGERGVHPVLDAALLLHRHSDVLDWDRMVAAVRGSWAATALRLMLSYVAATDLAPVPPEALRRFAAVDRHANQIAVALLHRMITTYMVEGQPFGPAPTAYHVQLVWRTLLRPMSPTANLLAVPYHLACPPRHPKRFSPRYAARRVRSFAHRALFRMRSGDE
jgi:hypothetical protein